MSLTLWVVLAHDICQKGIKFLIFTNQNINLTIAGTSPSGFKSTAQLKIDDILAFLGQNYSVVLTIANIRKITI